MKVQLLIAMVLMGVCAVCQAQDITALLRDRGYVEKQIKCVINQGPCDPVGRQIQQLLPEVLNNRCSRCTADQAKNARKLIEFMQAQYPNEWRAIVQRYSVRRG